MHFKTHCHCNWCIMQSIPGTCINAAVVKMINHMSQTQINSKIALEINQIYWPFPHKTILTVSSATCHDKWPMPGAVPVYPLAVQQLRSYLSPESSEYILTSSQLQSSSGNPCSRSSSAYTAKRPVDCHALKFQGSSTSRLQVRLQAYSLMSAGHNVYPLIAHLEYCRLLYIAHTIPLKACNVISQCT